MATTAQTSDLTDTINYLFDNILGLDGTSDLVNVTASPGTKNGLITLNLNFALGAWPQELLDQLSGLKLPFVTVDTTKLGDPTYVVGLQSTIQAQLSGFVNGYVGLAIEGVSGPERGIAEAATSALESLLSSKIINPISGLLSTSLLHLDLPSGADIAKTLGNAFDDLGADYFNQFIPDIAKTYGKLGLSEIITDIAGKTDSNWTKAINELNSGIFNKIVDNVVDNYFTVEGPLVSVFNGINFSSEFGKIISDLLVNFDALDKKIVDDILGIDGTGWLDTQLSAFLDKEISNIVGTGFTKALDFLSGTFDLNDFKTVIEQFGSSFDISNIVGGLFTSYAGNQLAQLFVNIDDLPTALASQLGSTLGSLALGDTLGDAAFTALFGDVASSAIGSSIFEGLGAILGAGVGGVAGALVFKLVDNVFDGALSGLINDIVDFFVNDSPQAYSEIKFDPTTDAFVVGGFSHKDSSGKLDTAVTTLAGAILTSINQVIGFVGQPAVVEQSYADIWTVWGKKHFDEKFATYVDSNESHKVAYSADGNFILQNTFGAILHHMSFGGNQTVAKAYELWKADTATTATSDASYSAPAALSALQNLIGLARFANAYRQDPTVYDQLMASDAPIGITILQQYLEAEVDGFNAAATLHGSELGTEEIGSAAAGDTIYLDGPAWRAVARGGDDRIYAGLAAHQEVDGGTGTDTLVLAKDRSAYTVTMLDRVGKQIVLTDTAGGITISADNVETFIFNGKTLSFDAAFPNHAPVVTSNGGGASVTIDLAENTAAVTTVIANDPDGEKLSYAIVGGADAALFSIDGTSGALVFNTAPDFEAPTDSTHSGSYQVVVAASDGIASDTQAVTVHVTNVVEGSLIQGTSGNDVINSTTSPAGQPKATDREDVIYGGDGNDVISAGGGPDFVLGDGGNDTLDGGAGNDQLFGWTGDDLLLGGAGNDLLSGEDGNDILAGGEGDDVLAGGAGSDTVDYSSAANGVTVSLSITSAQNTGQGIDTLSSVENLGGSPFNDVLTGDGGNNGLVGLAGDDIISGLAGDDVIVAGDGKDILIGGAGADTLTGGAGNDIFRDVRANFAGDRITDLAVGDRINVTDAAFSGFSYVRAGASLTLATGVTLDIGASNLRLVAAADGSGTDLVAANRMTGLADFNGDGHSDLLWRNDNGAVSDWTITGNVRSDQLRQGAFNGYAPTDWKIVESFDMNGDGLSDILWRNTSGAFSVWNATSTGFQPGSYTNTSVSPDWKIAGVGDFNADGKDDILWRQDGGALSYWLSTGAGFQAGAYNYGGVPTSWKVEGVADFNGDGNADILWRNISGAVSTWLGTGNGFQVDSYDSGAAMSWHVQGLGDFNGDGRDDILWRNDNGALSTWLSNGTGFDQARLGDGAPTDWHIAAVGDYNDDGKADIAWRNDNGAVSIWNVNANASGYDKAIADTFAPTGWRVAAHEFAL